MNYDYFTLAEVVNLLPKDFKIFLFVFQVFQLAEIFYKLHLSCLKRFIENLDI